MIQEKGIDENRSSLYELVHPECKKFISKEYCEFFEQYLIPLGIKFPTILINPSEEPICVDEIKLPCEIEKLYDVLMLLHKKFLAPKKVTFHELKSKTGEYKGTVLALIAFLSYPFHFIHKNVLSKYIRAINGNSQGDFQARHLAAQDGWNILNKNESYLGSFRTKSGFHIITDFTTSKLGYVADRRENHLTDFEEIKKHYNNRCATCGAKEGEPSPKKPTKTVSLHKGHCHPNLPLTDDNTIPQCEECNQSYKNNFVFDLNGIPMALGSTKIFKNTSQEIKNSCYAQLNIDEKILAIKTILDTTENKEDKNKLINWLTEQLKN